MSFNEDDATNSLKTSVSEGKSLIAAAVTGKGVNTAANDSFDTMASNIRSIKTQKYPWNYSNIGQYCTRYDSNYYAWEIIYPDGAILPSTITAFGMGYSNGGTRPNRTFGTYIYAYGPISLSSIPIGFSGTVSTTRTSYSMAAPSETAYSGGYDWKVESIVQANVYSVTHKLISGQYGSIKFQIQSQGGGWIEFSY